MSKIKAINNGTKKEAIHKKAAELFREKGFARSSMRMLAETMGIEAASLYNHIGSKSEILESICFKIAHQFTLHLNEVVSKSDSAISKLENLIRFHIHMMMVSYDELYVANHEWNQLEEPFLGEFSNQRKVYERGWVEIIQQGIKNKEIKETHPHVAVITLLSAVRGLEFWKRNQKNISIKELELNMTDLLLNGLIKKTIK